MQLFALLLLSMLTSGCSYLLCGYGLSCTAYYEERLDRMEIEWNQWLGKSKDERIKKEGPPDICSPLTDGGEVCEWRESGVSWGGGGYYSGNFGQSSVKGSSWMHRRIFTYDRDHIARAWSYQGKYGSRNSRPASSAIVR